MRTIYKYPLEITDHQEISIHAGAELLDIQVQNGSIYLWCMVNPNQSMRKYYFRVLGTGQPIESEFNVPYLATVQTGRFVWHIFGSIEKYKVSE